MSAGLTILGVLAGLVIAGLVIWLLILLFREEDLQHDDPIVFNFMPQYADGHAIGFEVNSSNVNNRIVLEYSPRDVSSRLLLEKKAVENVKVVADKGKVLTFEKGTLSNYRAIKFILPPNAEDFSPAMKLHPFGKAMMELTEGINAFNVESTVVRTGSDRKTKILEKMGDGEVSKEWMDATDDQFKEMSKRKESDNKPFQRPGGFTPPSNSGM